MSSEKLAFKGSKSNSQSTQETTMSSKESGAKKVMSLPKTAEEGTMSIDDSEENKSKETMSIPQSIEGSHGSSKKSVPGGARSMVEEQGDDVMLIGGRDVSMLEAQSEVPASNAKETMSSKESAINGVKSAKKVETEELMSIVQNGMSKDESANHGVMSTRQAETTNSRFLRKYVHIACSER